MKVKVLHEFVDRYTGKLHKVDEVMEINETRFNEIKKVGDFVEKINEEKPTKTKKK